MLKRNISSLLTWSISYSKVYKQLSQMTGMDVYRRDDIPDEYHYKNGRYVQEILVCAKPGNFFIINSEGKNEKKK